jgi:hypothetical protein
MDWSKFTPQDFEYDFERDELAAHHVTHTMLHSRKPSSASFQILRFAGISGIVIVINCLVERWVVESSRSFFN